MPCSRCASCNLAVECAPTRPSSVRSKGARPGARSQKSSVCTNNAPQSVSSGSGSKNSRFMASSRYEEDDTADTSPFMTPSDSINAALSDADSKAIRRFDTHASPIQSAASASTSINAAPCSVSPVPFLTDHFLSYTSAPSRYPSLISGSDSRSNHVLFPSSYTAQGNIASIGSTSLFTPPITSRLPSIIVVPPPEGTIDMPIRTFVDDGNDWTYTLPDPFLLAPPAQTSSGRMLHPFEYDIMQGFSYGYYSSLSSPGARGEAALDTYVGEDIVGGCAAIPSAFEDDDEEEEIRLLHGSSSVVEVYVNGGQLCERPATKLSIPPDIMRIHCATPSLCDEYDIDEDDDWEVVTPNGLADLNSLDNPYNVDASEGLVFPQVVTQLEQQETTLVDGRVPGKARDLRYMASAARGFMARWRV
ncbi:hypothetical protein PENSPDRAFT_655269 [Peniophora sp. CONT]|nr:hypothetical protein PENSPDRAFT_655269 [Peniophora sp. CONT]